jgi:hypothetical protein
MQEHKNPRQILGDANQRILKNQEEIENKNNNNRGRILGLTYWNRFRLGALVNFGRAASVLVGVVVVLMTEIVRRSLIINKLLLKIYSRGRLYTKKTIK